MLMEDVMVGITKSINEQEEGSIYWDLRRCLIICYITTLSFPFKGSWDTWQTKPSFCIPSYNTHLPAAWDQRGRLLHLAYSPRPPSVKWLLRGHCPQGGWNAGNQAVIWGVSKDLVRSIADSPLRKRLVGIFMKNYQADLFWWTIGLWFTVRDSVCSVVK